MSSSDSRWTNRSLARLRDVQVQIVDLGVAGARVESTQSLPTATQSALHFESPRGPIDLPCEIVPRTGTAASLHFISVPNGSDGALRRLLADLVTAAIQRLRRVSGLATGAPGFDPESTGMRIPVPYVCLRFESGVWSKRGAFIPLQPETGFTLPASWDAGELARVSDDYERAGEEGRRLIRLFAELRVCEALRPPSRT